MLFIPHAIMCGFEELGSVDMAATVRFSRGKVSDRPPRVGSVVSRNLVRLTWQLR